MKNQKLICLNLTKNKIEETNLEEIENFLENSFDNFQLVMNLNRITEEYANKLRKKYGKKIYI